MRVALTSGDQKKGVNRCVLQRWYECLCIKYGLPAQVYSAIHCYEVQSDGVIEFTLEVPLHMMGIHLNVKKIVPD